jgi:tetratricopeptide (TPR) repeat protein
VKFGRAAALVVVFFLPSIAAAQTSPQAQADFAAGQALVTAQKPAEAAERFEAVTKAEPDFAAGWYALAAARRKANQCDKAVPAYRRYAQMVPEEPEPYYGLGVCLKENGQMASAAQALRRYVDLEKRPSAKKWVAYARGVLDEIGGAGVDAPATGATTPPPAATPKPAATTTPVPTAPAAAAESPAASIYAKAQQLRDTGHIEESISKFKEAIATDPQHMASRAALGELLLKIRRDDEAITVFRAAVAKKPDYSLAWYDLAFGLRIKGRMPESVDAYQHYIQLKPTDPDPYYGLGRALQKLGRKEEALKAYQTYVGMEKRPTEQKWVDAAQVEIKALSATP